MDVNDKENVPVNVKLVKTYSGRRKSKKLSSDGTPLTVSVIVCSVKHSNSFLWLILNFHVYCGIYLWDGIFFDAYIHYKVF